MAMVMRRSTDRPYVARQAPATNTASEADPPDTHAEVRPRSDDG